MGSGDRPLVSHSIVWLCAHLHSGRALNRGLDQVGLQLNWESTEGEGSVVADACSASEDSSSQESAETAKPAHAVGLLTESMRPVSFTMKWCWLAPGEADTGVARVGLCTAKQMPAKSIFQYIGAWLSLQSGFFFFLSIILTFIGNAFCLPICYSSDVVYLHFLANVTGKICLKNVTT